jgi:transketolase N-terminal domain/subunit
VKLVETISPETLKNATLVADSNEFAIYAVGNDTYALVHRHKAVDWQAITISGDGLFRIAELLTKATRALYRDVAGDLSRAGQPNVR